MKPRMERTIGVFGSELAEPKVNQTTMNLVFEYVKVGNSTRKIGVADVYLV